MSTEAQSQHLQSGACARCRRRSESCWRIRPGLAWLARVCAAPLAVACAAAPGPVPASPAAETPAQTSEAATGVLVVQSPRMPGTAFLDGKEIGTTPAQITVPAGRHKIDVEYSPGSFESRWVTVIPGATVAVDVQPRTTDYAAAARSGWHVGGAVGSGYIAGEEFAGVSLVPAVVATCGLSTWAELRTGVGSSSRRLS